MRKERKASHPGSLEIRLDPEKMRDPLELLRAMRKLQRGQKYEGCLAEFHEHYGHDATGASEKKTSRFFLGGNSHPEGFSGHYRGKKKDY